MKSRIIFTGLVLVASVFGLGSSQAAPDASGRYLIGATPGLSVVCCTNTTTKTGVGGYQFPAVDALPKSISLVDDADGKEGIGVTVCQVLVDATPQPSCGDPGTIRISFRTDKTGTESLTNKGFVKNKTVAVFVRMADPLCSNIATTGTLTLKYI